MECNSSNLLNEGIEKLQELKQQLNEKINFIGNEQSGNSFGLNNIGGGFFSGFMGQIMNSEAGQLFQRLSAMFSGEMNIEKMLNLIIEYLSYKARRRSVSNGSAEVYSQSYGEVINLVSSDASDLIFLSKIGMENMLEDVQNREYLIDEIKADLDNINAQVDKIEGDESFEISDDMEDFKSISEELLKGLLELNQSFINAEGETLLYDSSSFNSAKKSVDKSIAILEVDDSYQFNEISFISSVKNLSDNLYELQKINATIVDKKEKISSYIENFKSNFYNFEVNEELMKDIQLDIRESKNLIDDFIEGRRTDSKTLKEEILVRLFSVLVQMSEYSSSILKQLDEMSKGIAEQEIQDNYDLYMSMKTELDSISEQDLELLVKESVLAINSAVSSINNKDTGRINTIKSAVNKISAATDLISSNEINYVTIYNNYDVRENPDAERLMKALEIKGYYSILQKAIEGDWGSFFGSLASDKLGLGNFSSGLSCVLSAEQNLDSSKKQVLFEINQLIDEFETSIYTNQRTRQEAVSESINSVKMEIGRIEQTIKKAQEV